MKCNLMQLRGYQQQAIGDLRKAYRNGCRAPLLCLPTGGGKTIIFSAIAQSAAVRGRQVLILVHRRELLHQASRKLTDIGLDHGLIAAGIAESNQAVQVASVQTLVRRLSRIDWQPSLIIIDEAHHASAGQWNRILSQWPDAYRLGVTATPCRLSGAGLGTAFDELVLGPSVADLIDAGFLSPARIYAPPQVADLTQLRRRAGDYAIDQAATAMDRPTVTGDAIAHYTRLASGQRAIAFCCNVQHAEHVATSFNAAGIPAATLLGSADPLRRDATVAAFDAGQVQVLVTVDVVSEGFDIPAASCAILLRPTQSLGLYLQQVGRVLRPAPGKQAAVVLDHVGNVHRHGWPDDPRQWSLEGVSRRAGTGGLAAPTVRTCPQCFAAFKPQPVCPCCGHEQPAPKTRPMRQVDGELQELRREGVRQRVAERRKARTLPQLLALAKQRGYSPAWAYKVHNARSRSA